jgi:hypothetical protein
VIPAVEQRSCFRGARRVSAPLLFAMLLLSALMARARGPAAAPRFPSQDPSDWVGSPVTWEGLRGKVVLIDVWTFG